MMIINFITNMTNKSKILALKEEYEKRMEGFKQLETTIDKDRTIIYTKLWELEMVVKDLEELLK